MPITIPGGSFEPCIRPGVPYLTCVEAALLLLFFIMAAFRAGFIPARYSQAKVLGGAGVGGVVLDLVNRFPRWERFAQLSSSPWVSCPTNTLGTIIIQLLRCYFRFTTSIREGQTGQALTQYTLLTIFLARRPRTKHRSGQGFFQSCNHDDHHDQSPIATHHDDHRRDGWYRRDQRGWRASSRSAANGNGMSLLTSPPTRVCPPHGAPSCCLRPGWQGVRSPLSSRALSPVAIAVTTLSRPSAASSSSTPLA